MVRESALMLHSLTKVVEVELTSMTNCLRRWYSKKIHAA